MLAKLSEAFHFPYFIHAGILDALTTIIALNIGFSELNPIITSLFPSYVFAIPAVLILLAYLRSFMVIILFKKSKYFKPMMWFSLYFPGLFNITGIVFYYQTEFVNCCFQITAMF